MNSVKALPKQQTDRFLENVSLFGLIVTFALFAYFFFSVIILISGAILFAVLLTLIADPICKRLRIHRWAGLLFALMLVFGLVGITAFLFGSQLAIDIQNVITRMGEAQNSLKASLESSEAGKAVLRRMGAVNLPLTDIATSVFTISANVLAGVVVALMAGGYLAAQPSLYLNGFLTLFPKEKRANAEETTTAVGKALSLWLKGQFISIVLVGTLCTLAVWAIGLPSPLALGLIAGITQFVPYVGPLLALIPALLVAATQDTNAVLWTLGAYTLIQGFEGNVISPVVQRKMVFVPPAIMLLGISALSVVFGSSALLFAAPIVVVVYVLVSKLYVRDSLGEDAAIPGEKTETAP